MGDDDAMHSPKIPQMFDKKDQMAVPPPTTNTSPYISIAPKSNFKIKRS